MKFDPYLSMTGESVEEFAARSGIPAQTVYKYRQGKRKPRLGSKNMRLIVQATSEQVTEYDFYDISPPPLSRRGTKSNSIQKELSE